LSVPAITRSPAPPPAPVIDFPKIDKELVKTNFFEYLDFALQLAPAGGSPTAKSTLARSVQL
jgi:hypothetical protein